jgi:hypothetical protein
VFTAPSIAPAVNIESCGQLHFRPSHGSGRPQKEESAHMPRVPPNFRRSDLQRAIRGAREEGLNIHRIEVGKDGGFTLHPKLEKSIEEPREDTEAEDWITKHKSKTGTKRHANKR